MSLTFSPELAAIIRVLAALAGLLMMARVLRSDRGHAGFDARAISVGGLLTVLGVIAIGGLVPVLGIELPAGALSSLYTLAAAVAFAIIAFWLWRGR